MMFEPKDIRIIELTVIIEKKRKYAILVGETSNNKKELQDKINRHNLYYDKAIGDADIVSSVEDLIKDYDKLIKKQKLSYVEQQIYSKLLVDLRATLENPKSS